MRMAYWMSQLPAPAEQHVSAGLSAWARQSPKASLSAGCQAFFPNAAQVNAVVVAGCVLSPR